MSDIAPEAEHLQTENAKTEIPVYNFFQKLARFVLFLVETAKHPKTLGLTQDQAEYIQTLFLSGATPEEIGRAMNTMYKRESFKYFQIFDDLTCRFVHKYADFEMDGLEYIWFCMQKVGALVKKRDGLYYELSHPMVIKLGGIATNAPLPEKKG